MDMNAGRISAPWSIRAGVVLGRIMPASGKSRVLPGLFILRRPANERKGRCRSI
jgi:hypothetical protein